MAVVVVLYDHQYFELEEDELLEEDEDVGGGGGADVGYGGLSNIILAWSAVSSEVCEVDALGGGGGGGAFLCLTEVCALVVEPAGVA